MTAYLVTEQAAEYVHLAVDTVLRKVAACQIPHRKVGGVRRIFFVPEELDAWINGVPLEVLPAPNGGRIVRPVENGRVK